MESTDPDDTLRMRKMNLNLGILLMLKDRFLLGADHLILLLIFYFICTDQLMQQCSLISFFVVTLPSNKSLINIYGEGHTTQLQIATLSVTYESDDLVFYVLSILFKFPDNGWVIMKDSVQ